jgi:hypothetical protein
VVAPPGSSSKLNATGLPDSASGHTDYLLIASPKT